LTRKEKVILILAVVAVPAIFYALDDLSVVIGVPARPRYSTFTINRFYRIDEKFNKYSLNPLPAVDEQCVNSLFPHFGSNPCWYVSRHTVQLIQLP
jgi:hypothetical protein